ncbi:MAG: DNA mismatch repair endonuclease MutL [Acidobacteria bacterium]|nr:DNA mismatch repair endonuclease MutL [Acidobacteriota bacterium]
MGHINVLSESVANQIAAGEVIERPASVVKELVENALDAGASRILVEIENGGADRIRVIDDGSGMEPDDAELAFERHATSKIRKATDLATVHTFGFRGEALPSIASVSDTTLTTSVGEGGWRVRIRAGRRVEAQPASHPRGTTVEVQHLFRNAPARRKFLRSSSTETAQIADRLTRIAVANPAVAFVFRNAGREVFNWPPVPAASDRLLQIVGPDLSGSLIPIDCTRGTSRVRGLASVPTIHRATSRDESLYVNGRPVRDRQLLHAVQDAYAGLLPRGRYPIAYLFVEIPTDEVDVNVHPTKSEVRFVRPGAVHDLVRDALRLALQGESPGVDPVPAWAVLGEPSPPPAWVVPARGRSGFPARPTGSGNSQTSRPSPILEPAGLLEQLPVDALAQYRDSYILASAPDGLVIVDQHAAHERILYDRLLRQSLSSRVERQRLLFPITLEVSVAQEQAFEAAADTFASLGFSITPFGAGALKVDEVPALVSETDAARLVSELLDELLEWEKMDGLEALRHRLVASAACHAAVRANHPLAFEEMKQIIVDLMRTDRPTTCPHGRPSLLRMPLETLEREFGRK